MLVALAVEFDVDCILVEDTISVDTFYDVLGTKICLYKLLF
jgi:hypothetical protein